MGLFDQVLIKENHIAAAGSITQAIGAARRSAPGITVEVEVESLAELGEALAAGPDIVLLDEFSLQDLRTAPWHLNRAQARPVKLEASGSMSLESVRDRRHRCGLHLHRKPDQARPCGGSVHAPGLHEGP